MIDRSSSAGAHDHVFGQDQRRPGETRTLIVIALTAITMVVEIITGWLFALACQEPDRESDLNPFWVYPLPDGAAIERHVPSLPLSREAARLPALRRSLAVYRMVFGQPRQDDLVDYLVQHIDAEQFAKTAEELRIDLTPPAV